MKDITICQYSSLTKCVGIDGAVYWKDRWHVIATESSSRIVHDGSKVIRDSLSCHKRRTGNFKVALSSYNTCKR